MIDTHCHLELKDFDRDRASVIERAKSSGVDIIITVATDLEDAQKAMKISEEFSGIYFSAGIHPHEAKDFNDETWKELLDILKHPKAVAVGETGLDYYRDRSPRDIQRDVFRRHIELSLNLDLPLIIHSRDAAEDTVKIIEEFDIKRAVLHCFSGSQEMARWAVKRGLYISIAGPVTFENSKKLPEIVKEIPDEFILIETDAPYLAPVPERGKRNEPAFLVHTARKIAELRGVSLEDIDRITTLNAKRLFKIEPLPEPTIAYKIRDKLYLNITNRCSNVCTFCVRFHTDYVKGHNLRLTEEPTPEELIERIGDPAKFKEIVFCGYGEPTLRLDVIKKVSAWIKERGGRVRINTNGHGNLINKRNILPELEGLVDSLSISLNSPDEETYNKICRPKIKGAFRAVLDFIREAKKHIPVVTVTVVEMDGVDIEACRRLAQELGVNLKIRKLGVVG
ncbi:MAG: YchF/TatD family DNA exonuclease [Thermodesulfovibrionales bacterium]|nr:YchF/TatD family DNA exonuclease [Thermodesulfovibrionales bacterium]